MRTSAAPSNGQKSPRRGGRQQYSEQATQKTSCVRPSVFLKEASRKNGRQEAIVGGLAKSKAWPLWHLQTPVHAPGRPFKVGCPQGDTHHIQSARANSAYVPFASFSWERQKAEQSGLYDFTLCCTLMWFKAVVTFEKNTCPSVDDPVCSISPGAWRPEAPRDSLLSLATGCQARPSLKVPFTWEASYSYHCAPGNLAAKRFFGCRCPHGKGFFFAPFWAVTSGQCSASHAVPQKAEV